MQMSQTAEVMNSTRRIMQLTRLLNTYQKEAGYGVLSTRWTACLSKGFPGGYCVTATHIFNGEDFFLIEPPECDYIISNPPYSLKGDVLQRLFDIGKPFAMLVGIVGLFESQKRFEMFRDNDFEIMYMNRRVAYFKDYAEQKPSLNPPFSSVYICHGVLPKKIVFEEIKKI